MNIGATVEFKVQALFYTDDADIAARWCLRQYPDDDIAKHKDAIKELRQRVYWLLGESLKEEWPTVEDSESFECEVERRSRWLLKQAGRVKAAQKEVTEWRDSELQRLATWRSQMTLDLGLGTALPWEDWEERFRLVVSAVAWVGEIRETLARTQPKAMPVLPTRATRDLFDALACEPGTIEYSGRNAFLAKRKDGGLIRDLPFASRKLAKAFLTKWPDLAGTQGIRLIIGVAQDVMLSGSCDLEYEGGGKGLCERYDIPICKWPNVMRALDAGAEWSQSGAWGKDKGLWTYRYRPGDFGRDSVLTINAAEVFDPHSLFERADKQAVPLVLAPVTGPRPTHAAILRMGIVTMARFVDCRADIAARKSVTLTAESREKLAAKARLPGQAVTKVFDRWCRDGDDGPAMLERQGDEFMVADNPTYRQAREWLLTGAESSAMQRQRRFAHGGTRRRVLLARKR